MSIRTIALALFLVAASLAGCIAPGMTDELPAPGLRPVPLPAPAGFETINATVTAPDGVALAITIVRPRGATADHPVPVLLHGHGWSGARCSAGCDARGELKEFLAAGFGIVSMDQRGHGESGGLASIMGEAELLGLMAVIDHVATLDWVLLDGPGDPRMGALGQSYGGVYQVLLAYEETRLKGHTRLDAIAPENRHHDLVTTLAPHGVPKGAWLALLDAFTAPDTRAEPWVREGFETTFATGQMSAEFKERLYRRSPAWYVEQGILLDVPVLSYQGVTDTLFPLDEAWRTHREGLTPEASKESILVGHRAGHGTFSPGPNPESFPPLFGGPLVRPCDARFANDNEHQLAWYRHHLLGESMTLGAPVQLATFERACLGFDALPEALEWRAVAPLTPAGTSVATGAAGRVALPVAQGPLTIAGIPRVNFTATAAGPDVRLFFALGVGSGPHDVRAAGNQWMPARASATGTFALADHELMGAIEHVPAGQTLFLLVASTADEYSPQGSRGKSVLVDDVRVALPLV